MQVRGKHGRSVTSIFGMLKRPATPARAIEELNEAAGRGMGGRGVKITADTNILV